MAKRLTEHSANQPEPTPSVFHGQTVITDHDIYLFKEGNHFKLYDKLGAHVTEINGVKGTYFGVWAPNAKYVSIIGNFNYWDSRSHPLGVRWDSSGVWEGFIPHVGKGELYKIFIQTDHQRCEKRDPFAFYSEEAPKTASIVWDLDYQWGDHKWIKNRRERNALNAPMSIYELHLGSWRRKVEEGNRYLSYREAALELVKYITDMGFTHVELLPVMEHPFYGSWGYQTIGYFAPTNRYGTPQDLMFLVDLLHQNNIGVILDWVPSHFASDEHGLVNFDGTALYEHADPRKGFHPDWGSYIFNYGRHEVREFLISSAMFWLDKYHVDGLRVDGVASMLYLDYSRKEGEWIPNEYGGRENSCAIHFLKRLNEVVYSYFPDIQMIAEESTAWPGVSRPVDLGGLGFGLKWNMGWMHDTLEYFTKDPVHRKYHHHDLTFSFLYMHSENYCLSLSHDEVVHGKRSLLGKMPSDDWQKFANLRCLLAYMYAHPGKKLLFMGGEIGQWGEWNHEQSLDWHTLNYGCHQGIQRLVRDLNRLYKDHPALFRHDFSGLGFQCIDGNDYEQSVLTFLRKDPESKECIAVACNFTPVVRSHYCVGVPFEGAWKEIFNSDSDIYGGSNHGNLGRVHTIQESHHGQPYALSLTLPPLGIVLLQKSSTV